MPYSPQGPGPQGPPDRSPHPATPTTPATGAPSQPQNQSHDHQIAAWWNFIGRTNERIAQIRADWQSGTRFGAVHGYARARLPAPEGPLTPLKPQGHER
nr:pirin-like C-terminal cupin domain-containing protein [Streptomyces sp. XY431]